MEDHHRHVAATGCSRFQSQQHLMEHRCTFRTTSKPIELAYMPTESIFQPEHSNTKHSIVLEDAHIPQDTKEGLASLLKGEFNSVISKSAMDVGKTNLFQMDTPTAGLPVAYKPYPIPLKYQKFVDEDITLLENVGCISKSLSPWVTPVIILPKMSDPLTLIRNNLV